MSTSQALQELYSLDASSPEIPPLLDVLIRRDEEEPYLSSLRGSELVRLVDFLDEVRILFPFGLVLSYRIPFTGYNYPSHHRRGLSAMFTQTANHLWQPHDPTIFIRRIW